MNSTYEEILYILSNGDPGLFRFVGNMKESEAAIVGVIREKQSFETWYTNEILFTED